MKHFSWIIVTFLLDASNMVTSSDWYHVSVTNPCYNKTTIYPNTFVNDTAIEGYGVFTCDVGFEMGYEQPGEAVIAVCNGTSGEWEFIDHNPNCQRIYCQSPAVPAFGEFDDDVRAYGETGNYTCDREYLVDGDATATCLADGSWSTDPPSCKIKCPRFSDTSTTARFNDGTCYDVSADQKTWSEADETCESVNGTLATIASNETLGFLQNTLSNVSDGYPNGYWIGGYEKPANASWRWHTSGDAITRFFWDVDGPSNQANDDRIILNHIKDFSWTALGNDQNRNDNVGLGFVCQFNSSCSDAQIDTGHDIDGACYYFQTGFFKWNEANSVDGNSGRDGCLKIGNREGFLAEIRNQAAQNEITEKIRQEGCPFHGTPCSYWIGAERVQSDEEREWLWLDGSAIITPWWGPGEPNDEVGEEGCLDLYKYPEGYLMNDESCSASLRFICQFRASNSTVICGDPGIPYHGQRTDVTTTPFLPGHSVEYTCEDGYKLKGSETITCQDDGSWNTTMPNCQAIDCGYEPTVQNATLLLSTSTKYRGTAVYGCLDGYELVGNPTIYCNKNGSWSIIEFTCLEITVMTTGIETTQIPSTLIDDVTTLVDDITPSIPTSISLNTIPVTTGMPIATTSIAISTKLTTDIASLPGSEETTVFSDSTAEMLTTVFDLQTSIPVMTSMDVSTADSSTWHGSTEGNGGLTDKATSLPDITTGKSSTQKTTEEMDTSMGIVDATTFSTTVGDATLLTSKPVEMSTEGLTTPLETTTIKLSSPPSSATASTSLPHSTPQQPPPATVSPFSTTHGITTDITDGSMTSVPMSKASTDIVTTTSATDLVTSSATESATSFSSVSQTRLMTTLKSSRSPSTKPPTATSSRATSAVVSSTLSSGTRSQEPLQTDGISTTETGQKDEPFPVVLVATVSAIFGLLLIILLLVCIIVLMTSSENKKSDSHNLLMTDFGRVPSSPSATPSNDYITSYEAMGNSVFADDEYRENILSYRPAMPRISSTTSSQSQNGWEPPPWSNAEGASRSSDAAANEPLYAKVYKDRELSVVRFPSTFEERLAEKRLYSFDPTKRPDLLQSDMMTGRDIVFEATE